MRFCFLITLVVYLVGIFGFIRQSPKSHSLEEPSPETAAMVKALVGPAESDERPPKHFRKATPGRALSLASERGGTNGPVEDSAPPEGEIADHCHVQQDEPSF